MSEVALRIVNPVLERASRAELLALQERRLVTRIRSAYERIPYYRRRWPKEAAKIDSYEAFREVIPFVEKKDFVAGQENFLEDRVARPGSPVTSLHMTSGTTGLGQEVHPLTRLDMEAAGAPWVYQAMWAGLNLGDSVFHTFPVGMQTGGLTSFHMGERIGSRTFQMGPYSTEKKIEYLLRFKPQGLVISPAYLTRFEAVLEERGVAPRDALPNLKAIFIAGESYTEEWARHAEQVWGAMISEWYGAMQGGMNQCFNCERGVLPGGKRGHLHCMEHRIVCEILKPETNEPVEPGEEGEMVLTPIYREAFPIVRFRTGDRMRLMSQPCPCGRPFKTIEAGTIARYDDMMKIRGQNLWPDAIDRIVFAGGDVEEYAGKVYVDSKGREQVEMAVEFKSGAGQSEETRANRLSELMRDVQTKLNVRIDMREAPPLSVPRFEFKTRRWTDERRAGRQHVRYTRD